MSFLIQVNANAHALHVRRSGSTGDNFNQLASNDGLSGTVILDLELANHLTSILGSILKRYLLAAIIEVSNRRVITHVHSVSAGRHLASVTLGKGPVEGVGKAVFAEVGQSLLLDLKSREVGWE